MKTNMILIDGIVIFTVTYRKQDITLYIEHKKLPRKYLFTLHCPCCCNRKTV